MKIPTSTELSEFLTRELTWRKRELLSLSLLIQKAKGYDKNTLIRAGIVMLYAHWEGYVKNAAEAYIDYINRRHLIHSYVQDNFAAASLKNFLSRLKTTNKYSLITSCYSEIKSHHNKKVSISTNIDTKSNLRKEAFGEILHLLGIPLNGFETSLSFINTLVDDRNYIAHGEYLPITESKYKEIERKTLELIKMFKTDIENSCVLEKFRK
jgi:hypothetical protein